MAGISVIIPVLREESRIADTLRQFASLRICCPTEIIVIDGDPGGGTLRALESSGVETELDGRVRIHGHCSLPGRGRQMNDGAERAQGDILLFLHADTRLPDNALPQACLLLENEAQVGAFDLEIDERGLWYRFLTWCANLRTHGTGIPYGDQAIFLKRRLFEDAGRYAEVPLMEDLDLMRRLKRRKARLRILTDRVRVSGRRYHKDGALYGPLRNNALALLFFLGVAPERLAQFYRYAALPAERESSGA